MAVASIYESVRAAVASGVDVENLELGDEKPDTGGIRWAPGAWDGVVSHHLGARVDETSVEAFGAAVVRAATDEGYAQLYALVADSPIVDAIDGVLDDVRTYGPDPVAMARLGRRLACTAAARGAVKLGIALLGRFGGGSDRDVLLALGRHSEFTLYAAVALGNRPDSDDDLWELARHVHGWGRIHLIERLAERPRPDIREWILRSGFRNAVMNEYLAWHAATAGGLLGHLLVDEVDDELLLATADILHALIMGGPARDMTDYPDGAAATMAYLSLVPSHRPDLTHLLTVSTIRDYVSTEQGEWPPGWTAALRDTCARTCSEIIAAPHWRDLASSGVESSDAAVAWQARRASRILGVSTVSVLVRQLRERDDDAKWYELMQQADASNIDAVLDLAVELLPLDEIASGPSLAVGIGGGFGRLMSLDFVVSALDRWPGRGWPLIEAALRSPGVRLRNMAVRTLEEWSRDDWPEHTEAVLGEASDREPDPDLRTRIDALLGRDRAGGSSR